MPSKRDPQADLNEEYRERGLKQLRHASDNLSWHGKHEFTGSQVSQALEAIERWIHEPQGVANQTARILRRFATNIDQATAMEADNLRED